MKQFDDWNKEKQSLHISLIQRMKRGLTKLFKRVSVKIEDSMFFVWLGKKFHTIRKAAVGSSLKVSFLNKRSLMSIRSFLMVKNRARALAVLSVFATALFLTACGGGGGGDTPTTVTKTGVCPDGVTKSGTGSTEAIAQTALDAQMATCAVAVVTSITPANGSIVSPPTVIATTTNSLLDQTSVTATNVTLTAGTVSVPGTVAIDTQKKGFSFTPTAKLLFNQVYTFAASLKDSLGRAFVVSSTFTTSSVSCTAPQVPSSDGQSCVTPVTCTPPAMANSLGNCMSPPAVGSTWNSAMKAWAYPVGMLVVGLNTLPQECVVIGDACWMEKIADGTIKLVSTNAIMTGYNTRPVIFAVYRTYDGFFNEMPLYADVPALGTGAGQTISNGGTSSDLTDVRGSDDGIMMTFPAFGCYKRIHTGAGGWGNVKLPSCPI